MSTDTREALAARLRQRGNDLRSHPIANSTIDCVEEAGELLIEAANALATQPAPKADTRETPAALPPLPEASHNPRGWSYTAEQMQAYARAAIAKATGEQA